MKSACTSTLKLVLWIVCIPHLIIGGLGVMPFLSISDLAAAVYKAKIIPSPQLEHVARMLAGYMLITGVLAFLALRDPLKNVAIIYGVIGLLSIRVIQMVSFSSQAFEVFGIPAAWYWAQAILFLILIGGLIYLRPRTEKSI